MLQSVRVSWDSDGAARARFGSCHHRVRVKEALHFPPKRTKPLLQAVRHQGREHLIQPCWNDAGDVRRFWQA
jgi:hypothetical protein